MTRRGRWSLTMFKGRRHVLCVTCEDGAVGQKSFSGIGDGLWFRLVPSVYLASRACVATRYHLIAEDSL